MRSPKCRPAGTVSAAQPAVDEVEDEDDADETGNEPRVIELVILQVSWSRCKAVVALKEDAEEETTISPRPEHSWLR